MCDLRDPEVIESLRYLLVPKEEKVRLATLPFNAKTAVFVGDKAEGFIEAEITSEDDANSMVTVKNKKGEVSWLLLVY
jgi:hypothetical protein